ncbi:MAG: Gfo/Idh/MocA family oxidoreductase [Synoicihabitans sp.]
MSSPLPLSRRRFIQNSTLLAGTFAIGAARGASPNGDIRVAVVGINSRGMKLVEDTIRTDGATLVALCDVDSSVLNKQAAKVESEHGVKADKVQSYRKLLERADIDAVALATPNHQHAIQTIWACQAGKDVYVEKPVCHTIWEGRQMLAAAKKYNRIVQPGFQNRSDTGLNEAFAWIKAGNIGKIEMVRGLCYKSRTSIGKRDTPMTPPTSVNYDEWLGPASDLPLYREKFHYDWHWSWNTGNGDFGNQGPHELDLMRWILDEPDHPKSVASYGSRFGWNDAGETPNMQITSFDWGGVPALFEVRDLWVRPDVNARANYKGNRVGVIVTCEGGEFRGGRGGGIIYYDGKKRGEQFQGDGGFDHMPAFIRAVRSRRESDLACTLETGFRSSSLAHWGNIPIQAGKPISAAKIDDIMKADEHLQETYERFSKHLDAWKIDRDVERWTAGPTLKIDAARERFTGAGAERANTFLHRKDRKGYKIPQLA